MPISEIRLHLPDWMDELIPDPERLFPTVEERMELAITLARRNIESGGGPFGAAVFAGENGRLIAPGVNLVMPGHCSSAHAEIVALSLAQQRLGLHQLGQEGGRFELVSSTEPCAMCLGAVPWSGVTRLICGARDEDARAIGFDEGDKPADWPDLLRRRGIDVLRDVCRVAAVAVLRAYVEQGGALYNGGPGRREGKSEK